MNAEKRILDFLKERGSVLQSEIHKNLGISKSTVSEILRRLEDEGIIVRERVAGKSYRVWYFENAPRYHKILRIGILRASEYPHVISGLKKLGTRYILKVFDSALDLTKEIASGRMDIGFSPFVTQTLFALLLKSMKIHAIVAMNGSGLVYKNNLKNCKIFATSEFSAMESNLKLTLERLGFNIYNLTFRYFRSVGDAVKSFESCEFDAMAIWEPYLQTFDRVLYFRDVIGDYPCCSMASNIEFWKSNREIIERIGKYIRKSKGFEGEVVEYISKITGIKDVEKSFESYKFLFELKEDHFRFLERYGIKLTRENIKDISDPL